MTPTFKKLNYKTQAEICVLNAPESFHAELKSMSKVCAVITDIKQCKEGAFMMLFAPEKKMLDKTAPAMIRKMQPDGVLWFCYPKGTSKKYKADYNRDTGWDVLAGLGYEPVRAVAIDEDWSALRFRKVENIKKLTRSFAITEEGKKRTGR